MAKNDNISMNFSPEMVRMMKQNEKKLAEAARAARRSTKDDPNKNTQSSPLRSTNPEKIKNAINDLKTNQKEVWKNLREVHAALGRTQKMFEQVYKGGFKAGLKSKPGQAKDDSNASQPPQTFLGMLVGLLQRTPAMGGGEGGGGGGGGRGGGRDKGPLDKVKDMAQKMSQSTNAQTAAAGKVLGVVTTAVKTFLKVNQLMTTGIPNFFGDTHAAANNQTLQDKGLRGMLFGQAVADMSQAWVKAKADVLNPGEFQTWDKQTAGSMPNYLRRAAKKGGFATAGDKALDGEETKLRDPTDMIGGPTRQGKGKLLNTAPEIARTEGGTDDATRNRRETQMRNPDDARERFNLPGDAATQPTLDERRTMQFIRQLSDPESDTNRKLDQDNNDAMRAAVLGGEIRR